MLRCTVLEIHVYLMQKLSLVVLIKTGFEDAESDSIKEYCVCFLLLIVVRERHGTHA